MSHPRLVFSRCFETQLTIWEGLAINPPLSVNEGGFLTLMGQKNPTSSTGRGRRGVGRVVRRAPIRRSMTRAAVTGVLDDDDDETVSWTSSSRTSSSWDDANRDDASTSASNGTDDVDDFDDFDDDAGRRREMRALERQIETSVDALKLLYLIDRYTGGSRGVDDEFVGDFKDDDDEFVDGRRWIRLLPILVLIYEGCVRDRTFSYDYAPQSTLVSGACSRHLNVCQDGKDDVDDLRERGFVDALKVTSKAYDHATLLGISKAGKEFLHRVVVSGTLSVSMRRSVDALVRGENRELLRVTYDRRASDFYLETSSSRVRSTVTDIEDVPYVSSPYFPASFLSSADYNISSGDKKAKAVLKTEQKIAKKHAKNEHVLLDDVRVLLTEFVPMGSNEMVAFCDKLGARERVPGGMYSALQNVDSSDFSNEFDMVVGVDAETKTKIRVLDADETSHVNVEADLLELGASKTNAAATQIEHFGIGFREHGVISYGLVVNGIADRVKENISLDLLARLLCDAHEDTSMLVANLFSVRQRAMLHCAFKGEPDNRDKYVCVMAERATPKLDAWSYMDGEEMENELKQIIGSTYFAHDLGEGGEVLIFGSRGVVVFGPRCERHHKLLAAHSELQARSTFLRHAFGQCFALTDALSVTRRLAQNHEKNPTNLAKIRERLAEHASTATILYEIQAFVAESLEVFDASRERLVDDADDASQTLYDVLHLNESWRRLQRRAVDMEKVVASCLRSLETLEDENRKITATKKLHIQETIERSTKNLEDAFREQARSGTTLEVTQVILSGTLAFDVVDRFSGQYLSFTSIRWAVDAVQPYLVDVPGMWLLLNVFAWVVFGGIVVFLIRYFRNAYCSFETKKITLDVPVDIARWRRFIAARDVEVATHGVERGRCVVKYAWTEPRDDVKWLGRPPRFEISVDERFGFALQVSVAVNKFTSRIAADDAWRLFWSDVIVARRIYDEGREIVDPEKGEVSYVPLAARDRDPEDDEDNDDWPSRVTRVGSTLRPHSLSRSLRRADSTGDRSFRRAPASREDEDEDDEDDDESARGGFLFPAADDDIVEDARDFTFDDFLASK